MKIQITPAYPPTHSGIGDYAEVLVRNGLFAGIDDNTIIASPGFASPFAVQAIILKELTSDALIRALEQIGSDKLLLHFSGYGYARWGLCYWLLQGLQEWKNISCHNRLTTLFHEVYASGPIWRSSFWTSVMQRDIAQRLACLSDAGFVTTKAGYNQLCRAFGPRPLEVLPVFSNIGEPDSVSSIYTRRQQAVVFGGAGTRQRAYEASAQDPIALSRLLDELQIDEIIDIGPGSVAPASLASRPVYSMGTLQASNISGVLSEVRAGLINYHRECLTKSTVAAAYLAHGVLLVNTCLAGRLPEDIVEGRQFLSLDFPINREANLEAIARAGYEWYQPNRIHEAVRRISSTM